MLTQELASNCDLSPCQSEIDNEQEERTPQSSVSDASIFRSKKCFSIVNNIPNNSNSNNNNNNNNVHFECSSSEDGVFSKVKNVNSFKTTKCNTKGLSYNTKITHSVTLPKKILTYGIKRQTSFRGPNANRFVYVKSNTKTPLESILHSNQHAINDIIISSNLNMNTSNECKYKFPVAFKAKTNSSSGIPNRNTPIRITSFRHAHSNNSSHGSKPPLTPITNNKCLKSQNIILDQVIYNTDKLYIRDVKGDLFYKKKICLNAAGIVRSKQMTKFKLKENEMLFSRRDGITLFSNNKNDANVDYVLNSSIGNLQFKIELSQKTLTYFFKPLISNEDRVSNAYNEIEQIGNDDSLFYLKIRNKIIILNRKVQTLLGNDTFVFIPDVHSEIISITKFGKDKRKEWQSFYDRIEIIGKDISDKKYRNDESDYDDADNDDIDNNKADIHDKRINMGGYIREEKKIYFDSEGLNSEWYVGYDKGKGAWYLDVDGEDYSHRDDAWEACYDEMEIKREIIMKNGKNIFKIYNKQRK